MPDDRLISDLASELATVDLSSQRPPAPPLVFGTLHGLSMSDLLPSPTMEQLVKSNQQRTDEHLTCLRNSNGQQRQELADIFQGQADMAATLSELKGLVHNCCKALPNFKTPGPTDPASVEKILSDKASRLQAIKDRGWDWVIDCKEKGLVPLAAFQDNDFFAQLADQQHKLKTGMVITPAMPALTASADLLASANASPISRAASETLPPAPSSAGTQLPFSAALAGRHTKFELPRPSKFSCIAADSDINAWLLRVHEYLTVGGVDPSVWVVFAGNYLDKAPLRLWEARKVQLASQPDVLYS